MTIAAPPALPVRGNKDTFPALADAYFAWISNVLTPSFNADIAALNLNSTIDTSASSVLIGLGSKSFTVSTGKSFQPGMYIVMASTAAPSTNSMVGQITSYNAGTGALVVNVLSVRGSGTIAAWVLSQSSEPNAGIYGTLKSTTALTDANATLTAAQMLGGEFTITPTAARTLTTDTASAIITALAGSVDGSNFEITISNKAGFNVTIVAGTGVTFEGSPIINGGTATWRVRRLTGSTVLLTRMDSAGSFPRMIVQDQKALGTSGGSSSAATNHTRDLNTVVSNTIAGASLASNQITLPAGTYRVKAFAPAFTVASHKAFLYNITTSALVVLGSSAYTNVAAVTLSHVDGVIVITSTSVFELRHYAQLAVVSTGLGAAVNVSAAGLEVYSSVEITKES